MDRNAEIRSAQERLIAGYRQGPKAAFSSTHASGHIGDGLTCTQTVTDMSKALSGDDKGPTPGFFILPGLVGCMAIGIKLAAAREAIAIERSMSISKWISTTVPCSASATIRQHRSRPVHDHAQSSALWKDVTAMVDRALAADPSFIALRDAQNVTARAVPGKE